MKVKYGELEGELISFTNQGEISEYWELIFRTAENERISIFPAKREKLFIKN